MKTSCKQVGTSLLWSLLNVFLIAHGAAAGDEDNAVKTNGQWAVKAARDGLRESNNYPWYDAEQDNLRQIEFEPPTPPREAQDWELNLPQWQQQQRNWNWNMTFWEGIQWVVWALLVVFFVAGCAPG